MKRFLLLVFFLALNIITIQSEVMPGKVGVVVTPLTSVDTTYDDFNLFDEDSIYSYDNSVRYLGGKNELMKYLKQNLKYLDSWLDCCIMGLVVVRFVVTEEGNVKNVNLIRGLEEHVNEHVLQVIKNMDKWKPGKKEETLTLHISFEIPTFNDNGIFIGCQLNTYPKLPDSHALIYKNLRYPKKSKKDKIEGTCILKFVVREDGSVSDITIIKSVSQEIDEEAIRLLKMTSGKWQPAEYDGKNVSVYKRMSIYFDLKNPHKKQPKLKKGVHYVAVSS